MPHSTSALRSLACAALLTLPVAGHAQASGNSGWFVPKSAQPPAAPAEHERAPRRVAPPPQMEDQGPPPEDEQSQTPPVLPLPPIPTSPDVPKGAPPPPAIIGVISVPDVMRESAAAQEAQRILGQRRDKLAQDAQHLQEQLRAEQQRLQAQAHSLNADQVQTRERHLQEEAFRAQRDFRNRARIIQEAAQVAMGQIERELNVIIPQVAAAHGMNLVFHSEQVALHFPAQDISDQTVQHLNQVLAHVFIPADGVDPEALAKSGQMPTTANPQAAPAAATAPQSVLRQHP